MVTVIDDHALEPSNRVKLLGNDLTVRDLKPLVIEVIVIAHPLQTQRTKMVKNDLLFPPTINVLAPIVPSHSPSWPPTKKPKQLKLRKPPPLTSGTVTPGGGAILAYLAGGSVSPILTLIQYGSGSRVKSAKEKPFVVRRLSLTTTATS